MTKKSAIILLTAAIIIVGVQLAIYMPKIRENRMGIKAARQFAPLASNSLARSMPSADLSVHWTTLGNGQIVVEGRVPRQDDVDVLRRVAAEIASPRPIAVRVAIGTNDAVPWREETNVVVFTIEAASKPSK